MPDTPPIPALAARITADVDALATAAVTASARVTVLEALLLRCGQMCREDGVALGAIAAALAADIDAALGS